MLDLRQWMRDADKMGELREVQGADLVAEVGAITELAQRRPGGPALLFDRFPGFSPGQRILVNSLGTLRRVALTMCMEGEWTPMTYVRAWKDRSRGLAPIPPRVVDDGPVLEQVWVGSDLDITRFPAPLWHEEDGGRYLGTGCAVITRDPEEGWVNVGTYRVMVYDATTIGLYISPGKHARIHREKYLKAGKPCPVAISFGHHPLFFLAASLEMPPRLCEYDWIGGVAGAPVDVVIGPATGLPIPAWSELAIEGEILPGETRIEGPFGEFTGYYASASRAEPFVKLRSIMARRDPINLGSPPIRPPSEDAFCRAITRSALIWEEMEKAGVPEIQGVWRHPAGGSRMITVVAIKQRYPGHARQAAVLAAQCRAGAYLGRYIIVVDDDIDPSDTDAVLWALSTRSDPKGDIDILDRCWSGPLDPIIPPGQKGFSSRAIIDATRPYEWKDAFPPVVGISPERAEQVRRKWGKALGWE
ncbi:MAG: UbiD family decarboxylase [Deltaproteobacteria bacterium]|nr:UbiD family decarboxylase [Deltaproteobacteria bacterium]MBI3078129.1 UbiD family decarboxylase [Deltaproteobacteria bacterium]